MNDSKFTSCVIVKPSYTALEKHESNFDMFCMHIKHFIQQLQDNICWNIIFFFIAGSYFFIIKASNIFNLSLQGVLCSIVISTNIFLNLFGCLWLLIYVLIALFWQERSEPIRVCSVYMANVRISFFFIVDIGEQYQKGHGNSLTTLFLHMGIFQVQRSW